MTGQVLKGLFDTVLSVFKEKDTATYTPVAGPPSTELDVIFLAKHQEVDSFGVAFGSAQPTAWIKSGVVTPDNGDTLEINSVVYTIREDEFDGHETIKLTLEAP